MFLVIYRNDEFVTSVSDDVEPYTEALPTSVTPKHTPTHSVPISVTPHTPLTTTHHSTVTPHTPYKLHTTIPHTAPPLSITPHTITSHTPHTTTLHTPYPKAYHAPPLQLMAPPTTSFTTPVKHPPPLPLNSPSIPNALPRTTHHSNTLFSASSSLTISATPPAITPQPQPNNRVSVTSTGNELIRGGWQDQTSVDIFTKLLETAQHAIVGRFSMAWYV